MWTMPRIIVRESQPYFGIRRRVKFDEIPSMADSTYPLLEAWMNEQAIRPSGPSFLKYNVIDMQGTLEIDKNGSRKSLSVSGDG